MHSIKTTHRVCLWLVFDFSMSTHNFMIGFFCLQHCSKFSWYGFQYSTVVCVHTKQVIISIFSLSSKSSYIQNYVYSSKFMRIDAVQFLKYFQSLAFHRNVQLHFDKVCQWSFRWICFFPIYCFDLFTYLSFYR